MMLWNQHLRLIINPTRISDAVYLFEHIEARLFDLLVLYPMNIRVEIPQQIALFPPLFEVTPKTPTGCALMVNREPDPGSGYWDHPVNYMDDSKAVLRFIDFFDWDELSEINMRYVRVRIVAFPNHPEVVGHEALILWDECRVFLSNEDNP